MASLYPKKKSPFWWIKFKDKDGKIHNESTGFKRDCRRETAEAQLHRAKMEVGEKTRAVSVVTGNNWDFARDHLKRHCQKPRTLARYLAAWDMIAHWMTLNRIHSPGQVTYHHVEAYLTWRTTTVKRSGKTVSWNTALLDVVPWTIVMQKAARLGMIAGNPLLKHGFKKEDVKKIKPEITDAEFETILSELDQEPQWMQDSFKIAMATGCRLRETIIPLSCVDLKNGILTFPTPKGGREKAFSIPIPETLLPMFRRMVDEGRKITLEMPFQPSRRWQQFFIRIKLPHLCFHCLRVTKVTRLRRAGVPREAAMRLVNHSSELIHLLYDRHQVEDLRQWSNLGSPSAAAAK